MSHVLSCLFDSFVGDLKQVYAQCVKCAVRLYFVVVGGIFEFLLRSTLFCFSFEYCRFFHLGIHSDCALSIRASPVKFKCFRPIYRLFKHERLSQTQQIREIFTNFCLKAYIQTWLRFDCFSANKNKQYIYTYRRHELPRQLYSVNIPSWYSVAVFF